MIRKKFFCILLIACFVGLPSWTGSASSLQSVPDSVHLHGQIRDTGGNPRQGLVVISTYLGPDIIQRVSTLDGFYEFDVPPLDHYMVTVFPIQRVAIGSSEVPVGFLDRWERVNRTTETDLRVDIVVKPGGTILLDAYTPQGNRMFVGDFPHQAMFVVYPLGSPPVTDPLHVLNHQRPLYYGLETVSGTVTYPAVLMLPSDAATPFTVWGLWTIPEAGTIMLEMDNGGLGYSVAEGEVKTINLVYEIARTELRKAQQKFNLKVGADYQFSPSVSLWLSQAQEDLNTSQALLEGGDSQRSAMSAYQVLTLTIRAKEAIALEVARQDIENRRLPVTISIVGEDQKPLNNVQVSYQQSNHDFILSGSWGENAVPVGDTLDTLQMVGNVNLYLDIAEDIGFEYLSGQTNWANIQREWPSVPYRFDDDVILHKLAERGFQATSGNTIWFMGSPHYYPTYLDGLNYTQVEANAVDFISTTLSHYAGKIQFYNLMNEPNSMNDLNFTPDQMLNFTKAVLDAGKAADPQALMFVNLSAPGLGSFGGGAGDESTSNYSTYNYLNEMLSAGVRPDAIGIQFYNGATLPAIDLGTASDLLDLYGRDFDLPFFISEFEYPTHEDYPGLVNLSSYWGWHQGHTDQAQADWAVGIYTLAFSKSHIMGATWSMSYDIPAFLIENGRAGDGYLHIDGLTLRPMAYALKDLFHSWTISGTDETTSAGQLLFNGFSGEYQLTLTAPNGAVQQETIHVRDGQTNSFTIVFDPDQTLNDNQHWAEVYLDKVNSAFQWATNLGKISGMEKARNLYSQAQTAYGSGQYWKTALLSQQAYDALSFKIDGEGEDWSGVAPLYNQNDSEAQANQSELRSFYGTMDDLELIMQFEFNTPTPRRNFLFVLDTGADGISDYEVTASPGDETLFFSEAYVGDPALIFTHLIPTIDVVYGSTVEIRIPLADLGYPDRVGVTLYREILDGGAPSGVIPSLGVMERPPGQIHIHSIVVTPGNIKLPVGGTQQFTARGFDADNNELSIEPIWTTSGGTIDSSGFYTANTTGEFTITASVQSSYVTGDANIEVSQTTIAPWVWLIGGFLTLGIMVATGYLIDRINKLKTISAGKDRHRK